MTIRHGTRADLSDDPDPVPEPRATLGGARLMDGVYAASRNVAPAGAERVPCGSVAVTRSR